MAGSVDGQAPGVCGQVTAATGVCARGGAARMPALNEVPLALPRTAGWAQQRVKCAWEREGISCQARKAVSASSGPHLVVVSVCLVNSLRGECP